jgi:hypothetical protein
MAAFLTGNRWSSGIGTHKTKEGRILCTGVGCLGCFPETNKTEADELGICDVVKGHRLRPFLDEDYNKKITVAMHKNSVSRKPKGHSKRKKKVKESLVVSKDICKETFDGSDCEANEIKNAVQKMTSSNLRTTGTQTARHDDERMVPNCSGLSRETQKIVYSMLSSQDFPGFTDKTLSVDNQFCAELERCKLGETIEHSTANSINQQHNLTENSVKNEAVNRKVNKTARILDNLYVIAKRDIAVNVHDNILPNEDKHLYWNSWDLGENAVCLYFDIEYFGSERTLPVFKVLEIVEALTEVVIVKDIKCVQRVNNIWQIVLRTRRDLPYLRQRGLRIRGRVYKLVEDIECYCQTIYGDA